jgi:transketolase
MKIIQLYKLIKLQILLFPLFFYLVGCENSNLKEKNMLDNRELTSPQNNSKIDVSIVEDLEKLKNENLNLVAKNKSLQNQVDKLERAEPESNIRRSEVNNKNNSSENKSKNSSKVINEIETASDKELKQTIKQFNQRVQKLSCVSGTLSSSINDGIHKLSPYLERGASQLCNKYNCTIH